MTWSLVTAPDERERCMIVVDGVRCSAATAWLVRGSAQDDYACTCADHVTLVAGDERAVERIAY